jgi:hypothetical protein
MSAKASKQTKTETKTNGLADIAAQVSNAVTANIAAPVTLKGSMAVAAKLVTSPTLPTGTLPAAFATLASQVVVLTAKGANSTAIVRRTSENAKGGACPFLSALVNAASSGLTLGQAFAQNNVAGHGQQGRGNGAYTMATALTYYINKQQWFTLK